MKACSKCKTQKSKELFWKNSRSLDGFHNWCKECWYENDRKKRHTEHYKNLKRNNWVKEKYSISSKEYEEMLERQDGVCAICEKSQLHKRLSIDHDHDCCEGKKSCGKCIRGLLCDACNKGLGMFKDNVPTMESAIKYLQKY